MARSETEGRSQASGINFLAERMLERINAIIIHAANLPVGTVKVRFTKQRFNNLTPTTGDLQRGQTQHKTDSQYPEYGIFHLCDSLLLVSSKAKAV